MQMRAMTEEERQEFAALCPPPLGQRMRRGLFVALWAGLVVGGLAYVLAVAGLWLWGKPDRQEWGLTLALGSAVACFGLVALGEWQRARKAAPLGQRISADLALGQVREERARIAEVRRLREPEHHTELLLLTMTDGRVRAILDDSTTDTEAGQPRRSTLRLAREVTVLHLPTSGFHITRFAGEAMRKPTAITSDPRGWPAEDVWLDAAAIAALRVAH